MSDEKKSVITIRLDTAEFWGLLLISTSVVLELRHIADALTKLASK